MSSPKRHHFVPSSYLKGFADPTSGFLHLYSARSKVWRRQRPEQVMVRNKYYAQDWVPAGIDKNVLELGLGQHVEPEGLAALRKLVRNPEALTEPETVSILTYLEFQRIRVPRFADIARATLENHLNSLVLQRPQGREILNGGRIEMKDSFRFDMMKTLVGRITPYFSRMLWRILPAPEGAEFVTSDCPVTFINPAVAPPVEPGVGLYGTTVIFPIDSRHLLTMAHREFLDKTRAPTDQLPQDLQHEDHAQIEMRRDFVPSHEQVQRFNRRMLQGAQDLIAASSKGVIDEVVGRAVSGG